MYIVAEPEPPLEDGAGRSATVGVARWHTPGAYGATRDARLTVVVRDVFHLAPGAAVTRAAPGEEPAWAALDFAPLKAQLDVGVEGTAVAATKTTRLSCRVAVGGVDRRFVVEAPSPRTEMALAPARVLTPGGEPGEPLSLTEPPWPASDLHAEDVDFSSYAAAPRSLRAAFLVPGARLRLEGVGALEMDVALPRERPWARVVAGGRTLPVDLLCDTLTVDTDARRVVLTYRGNVSLGTRSPPRVERIEVARAGDAGPDWGAVRRELQRGRYSCAMTRARVLSPRPLRPEQLDELGVAPYETWDGDAPEPALSLERYVSIAAELTELPSARASTLSAHGYDEARWTVEERGWLEKIARDAERGDGSLAAAYGAAFVAAQDALGDDEEKAHPVDSYVFVRATVEAARDPAAALDQTGLTMARWMRMHRHWTALAAGDAGVARDLERRLAIARAEIALGEAELEEGG